MYYRIPRRKNQATGVTLLNCEQLTKDCEAFVSNRSRPSSSSFAASAHMPFRSVGGEFDNEAVAVTAICSTFWLLGDQAHPDPTSCCDREGMNAVTDRHRCFSRVLDDQCADFRWLLCVRTPSHWPISILAGSGNKMSVASLVDGQCHVAATWLR